MGFTGSRSEELKALGVGVSNELAVVSARVLPPPRLMYGQNKQADISHHNAAWNLRHLRFYKGQQLRNWGVFVICTSSEDFTDPTDQRLHTLLSQFRQALGNSGITSDAVDESHIFGATLLNPKNMNNLSIHSILRNALLKPAHDKLSFLLVLLSDGDKRVYAAIRRICDVELGIPATCVQSLKIRNSSPSYLANVSLKINAKLGGVNHILHSTSSGWLMQESTMLVGMDVTHPG